MDCVLDCKEATERDNEHVQGKSVPNLSTSSICLRVFSVPSVVGNGSCTTLAS